MRRLSSTLCALAIAGCAHTAAPETTHNEAELTQLRERVARLERKLSDVDAQLRAVNEKREVSEIIVGEPVDYGASSAAYEPPTLEATSYTPDLVEDLVPEVASGPAPVIEVRSSPVGTAPVKEVYAHAMAAREDGRFQEAINGFNDVLARFPGHHLADNALYWSALCQHQMGRFKEAIELWRALPMRFPDSPKMPDALYGMAQAHEQLGEPVLAETLYAQLLEQYPKAEKGKSAKAALVRLRS